MANEWPLTRLADVCERVSVGHVGPTSEYFCDPKDGVPLLRSQNVRPGRLDLNDVRYVTHAFNKQIKKSQLRAGDILFVRVGQNRGDCCVVPEGLDEMNCANIVFARPPRNLSRFLGYYFQAPDGQHALLSITSGSAQGVLNTGAIASLEVPIPDADEAKGIAQVLGALEDKIELNRRMNATLEAMAQAVFKEWFVDGAKGEWDEKTIGDLIQLIMGQSPKGDTYNDQGEGLPLLNGAGDFTAGFPEASRYTSDPLRTSKEGDIVFTMRGTIGNLCIGDREYALGRCVSALKPKESFMKWPIYFTLERGLDQLRSQAMGSVITGLTKEDINRVPVVVPDKDTAKRFHDIVDPLMSRREHNRNESRTLAALRDTLLPKLMRGEVRVKQTAKA